jgi:D-threo-aldose 1-dehydrogenase
MAELESRRLGRTEMRPNAIGLGGAWWGAGSESDTIAGIERALELGINFLDTYPGPDEERWGKALSNGRREKIYLQSKVSSHVQNSSTSDHTAAATRRSIESSLKGLRTDYLDCVLIHGHDQENDFDPNNPDRRDQVDPLAPGNALDELIKIRDEGLIRHIGIGARQASVIKRAIATGEIEVVLTYLEYSLLTQAAVVDFFPVCREHDVGVILASPLGMGLLTGVEPEESDNRRKVPGKEPVAHAMWSWCRDRDVNIRHLAIQFCMGAPVDGIVLPGPANKEQVEDAVGAGTADIPAQIWRDFKAEFGVGL